MSRNVFKISFLAILLVMLMSVAMATDTTDNTMNDTSVSIQETIYDVTTNEIETKDLKTIEKKYGNENVKGDTQQNSKTINLDSRNFDEYVTNGKFNEKVTAGDTIDIQGKLDHKRFTLELDKPVNIISSNNEAYLNFERGTFMISQKASGSNITGITFADTHISIENVTNIKINNISTYNGGLSGLGSFTVRDYSNNITVTNSYFKTENNGGISNVVVAGAYNCLFENNTVIADGTKGFVGNVFYLTTYNSQSSNENITIRNNLIRSIGTDDMAICYGLVLEGTGHVIEGNIIDNKYAVMEQYADVDYGMETHINQIIFNNNTILRGTPQLVFPGIIANNTFLEGANLNKVHAYNNKFNTVHIQNNVKFENNTAKNVIINGNENQLNNNEIYASSSEYAVTITGANNTLTDNRLVSLNGKGEKAITHSSEFTSINNSDEIQGVYYITDDNADKYFDFHGTRWYVKDIFKSGDIIVLNLSKSIDYLGDWEEYYDNEYLTEDIILYIVNSTMPNVNHFEFYNPTYLINTSLPRAVIQGWKIHLINSTVTSVNYLSKENSIVLKEEHVITSLRNVASCIDGNTHKLNDGITSGDSIYVSICESSDVIIDKSVSLLGIKSCNYIDKNTYFIEGSEGTNVIGVNFNGAVEINASNINFYNCTFNKELFVNVGDVNFEGNTFNNTVTLNSTYDILFKDNIFNNENVPLSIISSRRTIVENNTIHTNSDKTILFEDTSSNNDIKNNILIAGELLGDDTVNSDSNTIENNGPAYQTEISIVNDEKLFINEPTSINITVNNKMNCSPVDKGYIEIYFDGILQKSVTLKNGKYSLNLSKEDTANNFRVTVWYIDGIRYQNNRAVKEISLQKADVTLLVNDFSAKLNEKTNIKVTVVKENGQLVEEGNLTFTIGKTKYTQEIKDGITNLNEIVTKEWLDAGRLTISFINTTSCNANVTSIRMNTSKADVIVIPMVNVENNNVGIELILKDELKENVIDGKVIISTLDGQELARGMVNNGLFTTNVTLTEDYNEEYLIANFTGSYYYNEFIRNVKITQMLNSTLTIQTNSPVYGEELIIQGKLVDSKNNPISDNITLNLNGTNVVISTDDNGEYTYKYVPELGINTIIATFNGNSDVYATSTSKNVTIRQTTQDMNEVLNQLEELQKEYDQLQEQLNNLTQQLNDTTNNLTQQNEELQKQNKELQKQLEDLINALTAPENTIISINQLNNVNYGEEITISGLLTTKKGVSLSGQTVLITANEKTVDVKTINGVFEYTTVLKSIGEQTFYVNYAGNENYLASEDSITFNVEKQSTIITIEDVESVKKGEITTIGGILYDENGNALTNSVVRLLVNNGRKTVTTNDMGEFSFDYTTTKVGNITVIATFEGNDYYEATTTETAFEVKALSTVITIDPMDTIIKGTQATITGTLTDENGNAIANAQVRITINGSPKTLKTDSEGKFTHTYTMGKVGENMITATYAGSTNYDEAEAQTTVEVTKAQAIITLDDIEEVTKGETATFIGKLTDANDKAIVNAQVKLNINGSQKTLTTDADGVFTHTFKMTKEGTNNIIAVFNGNNDFTKVETNSTVEVLKVE